MGIHDMGYRTFKGKIGGRAQRIWAIFVQDFMFRLKRIPTIIILILSYVLGLFPAVLFTYFFIAFAISAGEELVVNIFAVYYSIIFIWVGIYCMVIGAPIISNDMKHNAVILFFSRPLRKEDYFFGKFLTLFTLNLFITLVPAIIMSVTILGLATPELKEAMDTGRVAATLLSVGVFMSVVFTSVSILISSMTRNWVYAAVGIFAVLFFSNFLALILGAIINDKIMLLSLWQNFLIIADDGAGFNSMTDFSWVTSLAILIILTLVSLFASWRIIKRIEVI
jgi:ABC-2 type transport system permease protein